MDSLMPLGRETVTLDTKEVWVNSDKSKHTCVVAPLSIIQVPLGIALKREEKHWCWKVRILLSKQRLVDGKETTMFDGKREWDVKETLPAEDWAAMYPFSLTVDY